MSATPEMSPFERKIWDGLEPVTKERFQVVAAGPAAEAEIGAIEAELGFRIPSPYREFFGGRWNGLAVIADEEIWPPAKEFQVGPAWTFWPGLILLGIGGTDLPDWASVTGRLTRIREEWGVTDVVPLLTFDGDGSHFWGVRADGSVVEVFDDAVEPAEESFADIFAEQVAVLVDRSYEIEKRRGN